MNMLDKNGFMVTKDFISKQEVIESLKHININITKAASQINITRSEYLNCTGRWSTESIITKNISLLLDDKIKQQLESSYGSKVILKKSNIICKTKDLVDAIPFHQDISYSVNDPYHFSVWLALNDVDKFSAPLQVINNSHKWKIDPAVDYWSPYFTDQFDRNNKEIKSLIVFAGDAIIFDSRLYHGSDINCSFKERFAYVTRWVILDKVFPKIPPIEPLFFGMFNCGKITEKILHTASLSFNTKLESSSQTKTDLINIWIEFLQNNSNFKGIETSKAINDLKKLLILDAAYKMHQAGNISGLVYKNLWFSLLSFLNNEISINSVLQP